jgi:hypothetical protein
MTTKTTKAAKASKKTTTLHIATPGSGKPICGAGGKGIKTTLTPTEANCSDCQKITAHAEEKMKASKKTTDFAEEWGKAAASKSGDPTPKAAVQASIRAARKEQKPEAKPAAAPRERDPRLPPVGTVIKKLDRAGAVRCECKVTETGFIYNGTEFRSLSAAAMAAAKDLGVKGSVNGFLFFGLIKQQPHETDPIAALQSAWDRFHERVKTITGAELEDSIKMKISNALDRQGREILEASKTL